MSSFFKNVKRVAAGTKNAFIVENFLSDENYRKLEKCFEEYLNKGLRFESVDKHFVKSKAKAQKNTESYSAYVCMPGSILPEPLKVFATKEFQDWVSEVTGVVFTPDFTFSMHYHPEGSPSGWVHSDYELVNFRKTDSNTDLNLLTSGYSSQGKPIKDSGFYSVTRSVALLFYLDDKDWTPGQGGETGFFDEHKKPIAAFEPRRNVLGFFEVTPTSYHAFAGGNLRPRKSLVMWFHSAPEARFEKFRMLPGRASYDEIKTCNPQVDQNKLKELFDNVYKLIEVKQLAVSTDDIRRSYQMGQLILKWKLHWEVAQLSLAIALIKTCGVENISPFLDLIPETVFRSSRYFLTIDLNSLWQAAVEEEYTGQLYSEDRAKTALLPRQELMNMIVHLAADFVITRADRKSFDSIREKLIKSSKYIGSELTKRILIDVDLDRLLVKNAFRKLRTVLLTGPTSTLGRSILNNLLLEGSIVYAMARNPSDLNDLKNAFPDRLHIIKSDLSAIEQSFEQLKLIGLEKIDAFIHCAAVELTSDSTMNDWQNSFNVNTLAPYFITQKIFEARNETCVAVWFSSHAAFVAQPEVSCSNIYKGTKAALNRMCSALADSFPRHIAVTMLPGHFRSRINPQGPDVVDQVSVRSLNLMKSVLKMHSGGCFDLDGKRLL